MMKEEWTEINEELHRLRDENDKLKGWLETETMNREEFKKLRAENKQLASDKFFLNTKINELREELDAAREEVKNARGSEYKLGVMYDSVCGKLREENERLREALGDAEATLTEFGSHSDETRTGAVLRKIEALSPPSEAQQQKEGTKQ